MFVHAACWFADVSLTSHTANSENGNVQTMKSRWWKELQERGVSGVYRLNFLWQNENVFVMDNHLAAAWCWSQILSKNATYDFVHIDRHPDYLCSQLDKWMEHVPEDLGALTLEEYQALEYDIAGTTVPVFRFDNYWPIFERRYPQMFAERLVATHEDGDEPGGAYTYYAPWELLGALTAWFEAPRQRSTVLNLDLDYFFCDGRDEDDRVVFLDAEYRRALFECIAEGRRANKLAALTICLSPEYCNGWESSERVCKELSDAMGLDFALPSGP
jgi:hypothetical protein